MSQQKQKTEWGFKMKNLILISLILTALTGCQSLNNSVSNIKCSFDESVCTRDQIIEKYRYDKIKQQVALNAYDIRHGITNQTTTTKSKSKKTSSTKKATTTTAVQQPVVKQEEGETKQVETPTITESKQLLNDLNNL